MSQVTPPQQSKSSATTAGKMNDGCAQLLGWLAGTLGVSIQRAKTWNGWPLTSTPFREAGGVTHVHVTIAHPDSVADVEGTEGPIGAPRKPLTMGR